MSLSIDARGTALEDRSGGRDVQVTTARTDGVWLRHQSLAPFYFGYDAEHPVLLYLFNAAHPTEAETPRVRGSFVLLMPGDTLTIDTADPLEVLAVAYKDPAQAAEVGELPPEARRRGPDAGMRALAHEIRRVLLHEGEAASTYLESLTVSLLVRAVHVLRGTRPRESRMAMTPRTVRRVAEHIDSRIDERITVDELAAVSGLSRAHFSRAFAAATGESPHQFVLARRLAFVRAQLEAGAQDLAVLAARAGFSSHAHMSTAFRRAFGVSPRDYRAGEGARRTPGARLDRLPPAA